MLLSVVELRARNWDFEAESEREDPINRKQEVHIDMQAVAQYEEVRVCGGRGDVYELKMNILHL